jgi:hypothetical protein
MNNHFIIEHLEGISPSIKDSTLRENFIKTLKSLKGNMKSMEDKIGELEKKNSDLVMIHKTFDSENHNVFEKPKTLEEEMKIKILYDVYKKYSLSQIEDKINQ